MKLIFTKCVDLISLLQSYHKHTGLHRGGPGKASLEDNIITFPLVCGGIPLMTEGLQER